VPLVSDGTEQVNNDVVQVRPPGFEVTVYEVAPADATQATVAEALPATAVTPVGAAGASSGMTAALAAEAADVPAVFVAVAVNV